MQTFNVFNVFLIFILFSALIGGLFRSVLFIFQTLVTSSCFSVIDPLYFYLTLEHILYDLNIYPNFYYILFITYVLLCNELLKNLVVNQHNFFTASLGQESVHGFAGSSGSAFLQRLQFF